jgi:hypothetical protein
MRLVTWPRTRKITMIPIPEIELDPRSFSARITIEYGPFRRLDVKARQDNVPNNDDQ